MLTKDQQTAVIAKMKAAGLPVSKGTTLRNKFVGGEQLAAGEYTPVVEGIQLPTICPPRRKGGEPYEAIAFKTKVGNMVKISLGSIRNSIRVVEGMNPDTLAKGAKWAGEQAQPTKSYYRFGKLSDMPGEESLDEEDNSISSFYTPCEFTLATKVVYVAPRFIAGDNRPVFDEQCDLRTAVVVADYKDYEDLNAQR